MSVFTSYVWSTIRDNKYTRVNSTYGRYVLGSYLESISRFRNLSITGSNAPSVYYFDNSNQKKNIRINSLKDSTIVFNSNISNDKLTLFSNDIKVSKVILDGNLNTSADVAQTLSKIDLFGNVGNNLLTANSFDNKIDGGKGNDVMVGGRGNDTYIVDSLNDITTENTNEGIDVVESSITWTLSGNLENLILTGTNAINGTGNDLSNILTGNSANNILDGKGGTDIMNGGLGDDTYVVNISGDVITENINSGMDTVQSSITWTLDVNLENLTLTGNSEINGTGNVTNNIIKGNVSNNILNGGLGSDTMIGGLGNDTYIVDSLNDITTENTNEGIDVVESSITWTLSGNLENLILTGTNAINGTGNDLSNILTGNSANNTLTGGGGSDTLTGGSGLDTMIGGIGNDTYYIDDVDDIVIEYENEGDDTVISTVDYYLTPTPAYEIENIVLIGNSNINATGNHKSNVLTGNSGDNILSGGVIFDYSGPSSFDENDYYIYSDRLIGGSGNDTYYVQSNEDIVIELENEGVDTVFSNSGYVLPSNIENLTLTSHFSSQYSDFYAIGNGLNNVIFGNDHNNFIQGNDGNDTIIGNGGNDILDGGMGIDTFVFDVGSATIGKNTFFVGDKIHNHPIFDKITGLEIGIDMIDVYGNTIRKPTNIGKLIVSNNVFSYDNVISALGSKFTQDSVFLFTYGQRTFLGVDDGISGYNKDKDSIIEITRYTGNLSDLIVI